MNDLKWSLCNGKVSAHLFLLWFLVVPVLAGEAQTPVDAKAVSALGLQSNTTFHSDLATSRLAQQLAGESSQEPQRPVSTDARQEPSAPPPALPPTALPPDLPPTPQATPDQQGIQWKPLIAQSMTFLWIEHSFRFLTEPGTREELRGPFFKDWFNSVKRTRGWRDGDPFIVNYVGHPMQGSVTNYIFVHNDPKYVKEEMGLKKTYFKSRLRAMLFSTVYSTQFELGPLSEASLGNVGLHPSKASRHPSALVDLVVTPTLGTVWTMAEDALDRFVVRRVENHVENRVVRLLLRGFLNPSHSFANILRGKYPWHRDGRRL